LIEKSGIIIVALVIGSFLLMIHTGILKDKDNKINFNFKEDIDKEDL
jgi:hypothetical protein